MITQTQTENNIKKVDELEVDGLAGTSNSLAYKVHEIETHAHHYDKLVGLAASPSGETNRADRITDNVAAFQIDAGNNTWGSWVQILGSADTPVQAGMAYFDFDNILVIDHERNSAAYFIQFVEGESAGIAAKLVSEDFTETGLQTGGGSSEVGPVIVNGRRIAAGEKVWARALCPGQDTATIDFYIGFHEYEG